MFLSQECLDQVSSQLLLAVKKKDEVPVVERDVAALDINVIEVYQPFDAARFEIVPLPVWHCSDLISRDFSFLFAGALANLLLWFTFLTFSEMIPPCSMHADGLVLK